VRHYIWYKADGAIGGQEVHGGGFPNDCDLTDPDTQNPLAQQLRANRIRLNPEFAGYLAYDCSCDPSEVWCQCPYHKQATSYVDDGEIVARPTVTMVVDGVDTPSNTADAPLLRTPGANLSIKFRAPEVPNGVQIVVPRQASIGPDMVPNWPITFTFDGGETNSITLYAPAVRGMMSGLGFYEERWVAPLKLFVKGW